MKVMPEDLMEMVIAADALRNPQVEQTLARRYPHWKRRWVEPVFNLIGAVLGQLLAAMPWPIRWRADQQISRWLGARPEFAPAELAARRASLSDLARRLQSETGQDPASLLLTSHPPTIGTYEWLRFELVREGLHLANGLIDTGRPGLYPPTPQCFLAVDPYALDTVPRPVAGLYSGFMHRIYLVWDRQSRTQSRSQRYLLLRGTGYERITWRLLRALKAGAPVVMVVGGGLPSNARLLYAAREFVLDLPVQRWPYPKRLAQKKWMEAVIRPVDGVLPFAEGVLPQATRAALQGLLGEWGIPPGEQAAWIDRFAAEFRQPVPYRSRLFRLLLRRVVGTGQPLLFIAIAHREANPPIRISEPWGIYRDKGGRLQLLRGARNVPQPVSDIATLSAEFSREFIAF